MYFKNYYGACIFSDDGVLLVRDNVDAEKVTIEEAEKMFKRAEKVEEEFNDYLKIAGGRPIKIRKKRYWKFFKVVPKYQHSCGIKSVGMFEYHGDEWYRTDWKNISGSIFSAEECLETLHNATTKPFKEYSFEYWN